MPQAALFIGWGPHIPGREAAALDAFKEAKQFFEGSLKRGDIKAFEPVLLSHGGGSLSGFFLLRGDSEKIASLAAREDFTRLTVRASLVLENLTIIPAYIGDAVPKLMDVFRNEVNTLALQHEHA